MILKVGFEELQFPRQCSAIRSFFVLVRHPVIFFENSCRGEMRRGFYYKA